MWFAVECYFDSTTETGIRKLWTDLAAAQINSRMLENSARPHITLTVADGDLPSALIGRLEEFVAARTRFRISFGYFGLFPNDLGVMFLAPRPSVELIDLQVDWSAEILPLHLPVWEFYGAGDWTPHCTLAIGLNSDRLIDALNVCKTTEFPLEAEICEIGLTRSPPREELVSFALPRCLCRQDL
jgi:2'-5' RNA ligase